MNERQTCVDCGARSPPTETNYTLISARFGWRLARSIRADGTLLIEWRCPTCWDKYKAVRGAGVVAPQAATSRASTPRTPPPRRSSVKPPRGR
jgi:hypothetical protein